MTLHWPQITWLTLMFLVLLGALIRHGKPRSNESFPMRALAFLIVASLLYWGGFFGGSQ